MPPALKQAKSRFEVNFIRLLNSCINMASDKKHPDWRLKAYISSLQERLAELRQSPPPCPPSPEEMNEYTRKVEFLKGLLEIEKKATAVEKSKAAEELPSSSSRILSNGSVKQSTDLQHETRSRYQKEMRDELFGAEDKTGIRHRQPTSSEDLDTVLQHHSQMQEKIAEEMLMLASNMKANASAAGKIILDDNRRLQESNRLADSNYTKLKIESERLEVHARKACNWWLWIMIFAVCLTFIWMVIFIRMFPKA